MNVPDRELVIMLPHDRYNEQVMERQALWLHELLNHVETLDNYIQAVEFLNLHRGGISNNRLRIELALSRKTLGPFQFILHKN
ncbi:MAG TPA: hypothetical protein VFX43_10755 [Chitinophagaceae bacterium]|jgi:hypothetical protein|nr:hypothetical protein [Chitinophagaceae bacterium]